jgi:ElaB/YqjD/DUF883 family membrane-anchored ribosome-binding protein
MPAALMAGLLMLPGCGSSRTAGQKTTEGLVKQVDQSTAAVEKAREQVQATLASYNAILNSEASDPAKEYKNLAKQVDKTDSLVEKSRNATDKMLKTSENLFSQWSKAIDKIDSADLKAQATDRMNATRAQFDEIAASIQEGREIFDPFMVELNDQMTYMGFSLTPDTIAGLQDRAAALNVDAEALFVLVDEVLVATEEYKISVGGGK